MIWEESWLVRAVLQFSLYGADWIVSKYVLEMEPWVIHAVSVA